MSHIPTVGTKKLNIRAYIVSVYLLLIVMGATMVIPFMITISGSFSNDFDYQRFYPVPRFLWSQEDRFVKGLTKYFNDYKGWSGQMRAYFPDAPNTWASWMKIGEDQEGSDALARQHLDAVQGQPEKSKQIASDYSIFFDSYDLMDTQVAVSDIETIDLLREQYEHIYKKKNPELAKDMSSTELREAALNELSSVWGIPFKTFYSISFVKTEMKYPMGFQSWYPPAMDPKYVDFLNVKRAYRDHMFTPGIKSAWKSHCKEHGLQHVFPIMEDTAPDIKKAWQSFKAAHGPASPAIPLAMRAYWYKFLETSEDALRLSNLDIKDRFTVYTYNRLAGTQYTNLWTTPFPVPSEANAGIQKLWKFFVEERYPLRLTNLSVTPELAKKYHSFIQKEIKVIRVANKLLGFQNTRWDQFPLSPTPPNGYNEAEKNSRSVWMNFVKSLDYNEKNYKSSEKAYQSFLLKKYGSLANINAAYGWNLKTIEEAFPPLATAYAQTFLQHEWPMTLTPVWTNYEVIFDFLVMKGNALWVTFVLIALTILATLTINPLAAYSLSRFRMPASGKIILFLLATMAFPAMVSAIPAYLLMRDLGLLNSFTALVLPGAANGMAIFILKGFFDSLPQELYEAATIDGAREMQIFQMVAMPMVKPILAINCVNAFIQAYNGWQWALIICQDQEMWTLAVWMYQASQWWKSVPWLVSAGFVIVSIPTMIVFLSSQKVILKGIVVPSMK